MVRAEATKYSPGTYVMDDQVKWYYRFHFGKKTRSIFDYAKLGTVLNLGIGDFSLLPGVDRREAFNLIDSIQKKTNAEFLNDYIISRSLSFFRIVLSAKSEEST